MIPIGTPKGTIVQRRGRTAEVVSDGDTPETFKAKRKGIVMVYQRHAWNLGGFIPDPRVSPPAKMSEAARQRLEGIASGRIIVTKPHVPIIVRLHGGTDQEAANATDATLKMLPLPGTPGPMGGNVRLQRSPDGKVEFNPQGYAVIWTSEPRFVEFAITRQGYVAEVIK